MRRFQTGKAHPVVHTFSSSFELAVNPGKRRIRIAAVQTRIEYGWRHFGPRKQYAQVSLLIQVSNGAILTTHFLLRNGPTYCSGGDLPMSSTLSVWMWVLESLFPDLAENKSFMVGGIVHREKSEFKGTLLSTYKERIRPVIRAIIASSLDLGPKNFEERINTSGWLSLEAKVSLSCFHNWTCDTHSMPVVHVDIFDISIYSLDLSWSLLYVLRHARQALI